MSYTILKDLELTYIKKYKISSLNIQDTEVEKR